MRRPGARGRGDDRLRHPRLPVARSGPPAARRIAGCRCDRLAGRPTAFGRPRLPGAGAAAGPQAPQGGRPSPDVRGPRGPAYRGEAQGRRSSPPRSARPSRSPGLASRARQRSARPAGSGSRGIRTPRRPWPARTRSSPKAASAAKASSSARTSTPAARSSTTRGSSTPAGSSPHRTSSSPASSAPASPASPRASTPARSRSAAASTCPATPRASTPPSPRRSAAGPSRSGHGMPNRLNPLDEGHRPSGLDDAQWASQVASRRRDLVGALAETVLDRRLTPLEHTAVDIAHRPHRPRRRRTGPADGRRPAPRPRPGRRPRRPARRGRPPRRPRPAPPRRRRPRRALRRALHGARSTRRCR